MCLGHSHRHAPALGDSRRLGVAAPIAELHALSMLALSSARSAAAATLPKHGQRLPVSQPQKGSVLTLAPLCPSPSPPGAGQTLNSTSTLEHLAVSDPDLVILVGDLAYAGRRSWAM